MRILLLVTIALLMACASRDTPAVEPAGVASRVEVHGRGILFPLETTGGDRGIAAYQIPLPLEATWAGMSATFESLGFRGAGAVDETRRIFGYPDGVFPRRIGQNRLSHFLECGHSPAGHNADTYRVTGSVLTVLRPADEPERSVMEVTVEAIARPREVSGNPVRCSSNGRLERLIAQTAMRRAIDAL